MGLNTIPKRLIGEKGISITYLSRTAKVPLQTLHGWLQGTDPKSIWQIKKVANYFEVDLDYLYFGIGQEKSKNKIEELQDEINAGIFEAILRRVTR